MTPVLENAAIVFGSIFVGGAVYLSISGPDWLNRGLGLVMALFSAACGGALLLFGGGK